MVLGQVPPRSDTIWQSTMNMADGKVGPVQCHAHSIGAGLWACPILHISFQSCLSPPNATLRIDSPIYPSVLIIAHAANHLTCRCSCKLHLHLRPDPHHHQPDCSTAGTAATSTTSSASREPRGKRKLTSTPDRHLHLHLHLDRVPSGLLASLPHPKSTKTTTLSTSTTLSTPTSRRLHCGFQDFRLRFCTQE